MCGSLGTEPGLQEVSHWPRSLPQHVVAAWGISAGSALLCGLLGRSDTGVKGASLTLELVGHVVVQTARPRMESQQDIQERERGGGGGEEDTHRERTRTRKLSQRERDRELELESLRETDRQRWSDRERERERQKDRDTERDRERVN